MDIDYKSLLFLLKASSKAKVKTLMRLSSIYPLPKVLSEIQTEMDLSDSEFKSLLNNITKLEMLYTRGMPLDFPPDFHNNLKNLIETVLDELQDIIVKESVQPGLPKYEGID